MRESIVPMLLKPRRSHDSSWVHRCDEFQPGNPRRVALQQGSLPLPRPSSGSTINSHSPTKTQRMAHRAFPICLTQGVHPNLRASLSIPPLATSPPNPLKTLPQNPSPSLPINSAKRAQSLYERNHSHHAKNQGREPASGPALRARNQSKKIPLFSPQKPI